MQRIHYYLGSLLMGATLLHPVVIRAGANPQWDRHQAYKLRDDDDKRQGNKHYKRYYDRDRKDYHDWDDREDGVYRRWIIEERHETYNPFNKLKREMQGEYWKWRHEHPDNDRDRR